MAFTPSQSGVVEPRSWSVGPVKTQIVKFSAASGDTSGTVTAGNLSRIDYIAVMGLTLTAAPTLSSNTAVLAFSDPAATVYGTAICYGR